MVTFFTRLGLCLGLWACALGTAYARPVEDTMTQRTLACTACHGEQGRAGPDGYYPRLAGKPAGYLYNQLTHFQQGRRHYAPMLNLLEPLSDAYLHEIAEHFASQAPPYPAPAPVDASAALLARGKQLAKQGDKALGVPACTQCHGDALTGVLPATPGLLGLPQAYLSAQLGGWKSGQRSAHAPDCMAGVARKLRVEDVNAVATWLATQPVPLDAKAATTRPAWPKDEAEIACGTAPAKTVDNQASRGAYLARIGNCASCHTARGGEPYAGGRAIDTPFGAVYSTNLTSDPATGLGTWNAQDFWQALHHGKSKDGRLLNPAFPYTSYTHVNREDSDALFAFFQRLAPVHRMATPHKLTWPLGTQAALAAWRTLYFTPASPPQDRGAYLVKGLGHCAECHAQRNSLGGITSAGLSQGGTLPMSPWYAPSLHRSDEAGVAPWPESAIVQFLISGKSGNAIATGPMAEVVLNGTQYLQAADALAIAKYLKSLPPAPPLAASPAVMPAKMAKVTLQRGAAIYDKHCSDCHGTKGQGYEGIYPALAGNRAVNAAHAQNLGLAVLNGGFAPSTTANARPFGMPAYVLTLSDAEVAAVLTYIRGSWGNNGTMVNEFDINKLRSSPRR